MRLRTVLALRRSSREIVDGARRSSRAIDRTTVAGQSQVGDLNALILGQVASADRADGESVERWDEADESSRV